MTRNETIEEELVNDQIEDYLLELQVYLHKRRRGTADLSDAVAILSTLNKLDTLIDNIAYGKHA